MEELSSKLGFDAAQALATLRELDGVLAKFEKTVGGTGKGLDLFNKRAGKTVGALKQIKSGADRAFASLDRLARARGAAVGSTPGTSGTAASVRSEADAVLAHLANVKAKFAEIPAIARTEHKRAFESAATKVAEYAKRSGKSMDDVRRIQNNLGQSFTGAENKIADGLQRVEKSYGKLGETGTRSTKALTVSWETLARVVATQMIVRALSMVRNAINDAYNDSIDFQRQIAEIRTISPIKNLNCLAATVRGLSDEFNQPLGDVSEGLYQVISNQIQGTANQVDVLTTSLKFSKVAVASTEDSVNLLTGTLNAFGKDASESETIAAKFFKTIELGRNLGILQESLEVRKKLKGNPFTEGGGGEEQLRQVEQFLYEVEQQSKRAATSTSQVQINLSSATSPAQSLAESSLVAANAMERMARASGQITMPRIPTTPTLTSAKGGLVQVARHLSQGGFLPQGTDTVPAMLSPGEFVVNARSTRKFFSQLVAINAGARPVYRQEGGPVTNVGDIHVNVRGGETARQSARTIAAGVRRELRRGTSTL